MHSVVLNTRLSLSLSLLLLLLQACSDLPAVTKALEEAGLWESREGDGVLPIRFGVVVGEFRFLRAILLSIAAYQ